MDQERLNGAGPLPETEPARASGQATATAYARLRQALTDARRDYPTDDQRLVRAALSLLAVLKFLEHDATIAPAGLDRELWNLLAAVKDIDAGAGSTWLDPHKPPHKPPLRVAQKSIRDTAAIAMHELMAGGLQKAAAAQKVARSMITGNLKLTSDRKGGVTPLWHRVAAWRDERPQPHTQETAWPELRLWRATYKQETGCDGTPSGRAEYLLRMLQGGLVKKLKSKKTPS